MTLRYLNLDAIAAAASAKEPYPHFMAEGALATEVMPALTADFPAIKKPGYFPLDLLKREGAFEALVADLHSPKLADILSGKLGLDLTDKPRMITVRKWSAGGDGRIHNDGEAKICTSLLYLNPQWPEGDAGRLRVLKSKKSFDDTVFEVPPVFGNFFAFKRTENSWHGHKPFAGERRVIQITWLRSQEDLERKHRRGHLSHFLKKIFSRSEY